MKNRLYILLLTTAVWQMCPIEKTYAWQMFYRTPVIAGQVLDSTTGQPIENAVLEVKWVINSYTGLEEHIKEAGDKILITDNTGRYCIPAKTFGHMPLMIIGGSQFHHIQVSVLHPYSEAGGVWWNKTELKYLRKGYTGIYLDFSHLKKADREKCEIKVEDEIRLSGMKREEYLKDRWVGYQVVLDGRYVNDTLRYDIKMVSLKEKNKEKDFCELPVLKDGYFNAIRELGVYLNVDTLFVNAYKLLDEKYATHPEQLRVKLFIKEREEKIRKILSDEKK
jgi:hypothetical protein